MKAFEVVPTEDASADLEELHEHIARHDAPARADHVLDRIQEILDTLATFPERGSYPG